MTMELDASQRHAAELIARAQLAAVTGPPGSGKTTTLNTALGMLDAGTRVALAAPTGKAARRLAQLTGREASTIHRLLGYRGPRDGFTVDEVPADLVVIDEASMLDYELAVALLARTRGCRLVLVGDANQLPPVGPGRLFGDLIDAEAIPVARLTGQHRAAQGSWVARVAPSVMTGGPLDMEPCAGFEFIEVDHSMDVPRAVREVAAASPGVMVLAPQRTGLCGCHALAAGLDAVMNEHAPVAGPHEIVLPRGTDEEPQIPLRVGTRVIQVANNYDLDVMNGELGTITAITPGDTGRVAEVVVRYEDLARDVVYTAAESRQLECAYALTVHKVQGSEFTHVLFVCHSSHTRMLNRSLLYTAITRARQRVTLVGNALGLEVALRRVADSRATTLVQRMAGQLEPLYELP